MELERDLVVAFDEQRWQCSVMELEKDLIVLEERERERERERIENVLEELENQFEKKVLGLKFFF